MTVCACGRSTNEGQSLCDRCTALVVFGLKPDATQSEIKDAYRVLAKVWHPDRFQGDERLRLAAEEKLKEINAAYHLLTTTPAEQPHRRPSAPPPQPEPPPRADTEASAQWSPPRPITNHFAYAIRLQRRAARIRVAIVLIVVLATGAWVVERYGRTLAYEFNIPIGNSVSTTRQAAPAGNLPKRTAGNSEAAGNNPAKATHARTAPAQGPSLLVYPADDPQVPYFTIGSTKSDVLKVQGTPGKIAGNTFQYGLSAVYFQDGRVQSWHSDPSLPLKARMPE